MWSDTETAQDFLNYGELAEVVALMLADPKMLPLSVGVSGGWGTGKSSFLKMVEAKLAGVPRPGGSDTCPQFIVVHYDAWLYQGYDDARAALMDRISSRLMAEAERRDKTLAETGASLWRRVRKLRALALAADAALTLGGVPTLGFLAKGASAVERMAEGHVGAAEMGNAREAAKKGGEELKGLLRPEEKASPPQEIEAFREEFAGLLEKVGAVLVVFIDNLDRCLPAQVIHTLEALRLFLFMGNTAFCVAADEDMVRGSIRRHFEDIEGSHVRDYLDKLIQVPVRVPRLGVPEITSYLMLLFAEADPSVPSERMAALREGVAGALREAWKGGPMGAAAAARLVSDPPPDALLASFELAERMAPLLANATAINGNPRIIKRLLNTVRIRTRLAVVRGLPVDETVIAKLALFERCMGERAAASLYSDVQAAPDGRSARLHALQTAGLDGLKSACPPDWQGAEQERFLGEWVFLEPLLGGLDLRAVSHLSRDTMAMAGRRRGLSGDAADALNVLSSVERLPSKAGSDAAGKVPAAERVDVMRLLLTAMRRHDDWKRPPPELNGARLLARGDEDCNREFRAFLTGVGGANPAPWLKLLQEHKDPSGGGGV